MQNGNYDVVLKCPQPTQIMKGKVTFTSEKIYILGGFLLPFQGVFVPIDSVLIEIGGRHFYNEKVVLCMGEGRFSWVGGKL